MADSAIATSLYNSGPQTHPQAVEGGQKDIAHKLSEVDIDIVPITTLPEELLAGIFYRGHQLSQGDQVQFRSSICLVSRHWRDAAINASALWSNVVIQDHSPPEYIEMCLRRSRDRSLTIRFAFSDATLQDIDAVLPLLTPSVYRWRKLSIEVDEQHTLDPILRYLQNLEAPLLEVLSVTLANPEFLRDDGAMFQIFMHGAPRLSSLSLVFVDLHGCCPPTKNVTTFYMHGGDPHNDISGSRFFEILEALPSVVEVSLLDSVAHIVPGDIPRKLNMDSLRVLMIHAGYGTTDGGDTYLHHVLIDVISAPNLETLVIMGGIDDTLHNTYASLATTPLKFPALTSLELWNTFSRGITCEFFQSLPNLRELTLIQCGDDALERLLEGYGMFLPHLHTLTFESMVADGDEEAQTASDQKTLDLLCRLVSFRLTLGIPIKTLRLDSVLCSADPERIKTLRGFVPVEEMDPASLDWESIGDGTRLEAANGP